MCGIMGVFGNSNSVNLVKKGLKTIEQRGKDSYGISNLKKSSFSKKMRI